MKTQIANLFVFTQKIKPQHVQLVVSLLALILFVVAAGAPEDGGLTPH